jgi:lipopolysaccharide biosynthesis glycosyltransferase
MKSCFVFSVDDSFIMPFEVTLFSLVKHNPWVVNVPLFVIFDAETLNERNRLHLREKVVAKYGIACTLIDCSGYLPPNLEVFNYQHVSKATFFRLLISSMLDETFGQAVYLDSDILVVGDISYLYQNNFSGPIAAVKNYAPSEEVRLFGDSGGSYFNAGITVFNLELIREHKLQLAYMDLIQSQPEKLLCWDQDVLNLIHRDQWIQLPWYYNVTRHMMESFQIINKNFYKKLDKSNIRIIHFDGPSKPWELNSDRSFADVWRSYYFQLNGKIHLSDSFIYKVKRSFFRFKNNLARFKRDFY